MRSSRAELAGGCQREPGGCFPGSGYGHRGVDGTAAGSGAAEVVVAVGVADDVERNRDQSTVVAAVAGNRP